MSTDQIARIDRKIEELLRQRRQLVATADLSLWDSTQGYEVSRRAIEVAAVGGHSICFLAEDLHGSLLTALATQMGVRATHTARCPCGHYDNPYRQCTCKMAVVRRFHNTKAFRTKLSHDMVVDEMGADYPVPSQHPPELRERVLARIAEAILRNAVYVDSSDNQQFLRMCQVDMRWSDRDVARVIAIAVTIAKLGGLAHPGVPELCEASQYQGRRSILGQV